MIRVAINGFGRIGRMCLRASFDNPNMQVVALNDLSSIEASAHLLKYDSFHGRLDREVSISSNGKNLIVGNQEILCLSERSPENLPWKYLDVDVVIESTGFFTKYDDAEKHLKAGAKKVVISAPSSGDKPVKTFVLGVNEETYDPDKDHVVSNASCTTNCLAPVAKLIHDEYKIQRGFMTTVHAYTNDQQILDVAHKDLRRARSAASNIIPTTTGAARAVTKVIPDLKGKLDGMAFRVPVPLGSVTDFVADLSKNATRENINALFKEAAVSKKFNHIIEYTEEPIVSSDIIGNTHSTIFDALSTMVMQNNFVKVVMWYDNETGYSHRVVELAEYLMK